MRTADARRRLPGAHGPLTGLVRPGLGKPPDKGLKAIEDLRLEPREIRGIIAELHQVIADGLEAVADLRATERHLAGQS